LTENARFALANQEKKKRNGKRSRERGDKNTKEQKKHRKGTEKSKNIYKVTIGANEQRTNEQIPTGVWPNQHQGGILLNIQYSLIQTEIIYK